MRKRIRLSESDLYRVVKEATKRVIREMNSRSFNRPRRYSTMLREGSQWIGNYDSNNFEILLRRANELGGNCSFGLAGCDFTMMRTQRGFTVTSGTDHVTDSLYLRSACIAAWDYANKTGDFNPKMKWSPASRPRQPKGYRRR